ncbi:MAG: DUF2986 domain-containing protein [Gammaproteobacteria bacterium]|nr:DUF2986 domain-containing protein [Gammaproteobacteria bacterium]
MNRRKKIIQKWLKKPKRDQAKRQANKKTAYISKADRAAMAEAAENAPETAPQQTDNKN